MSIPHGNLFVASSCLLEIPLRRTHIVVASRVPPTNVDDLVAGQRTRRKHSLRSDSAATRSVKELEVDVTATRSPGASAMTNARTGGQGMRRLRVVPRAFLQMRRARPRSLMGDVDVVAIAIGIPANGMDVPIAGIEDEGATVIRIRPTAVEVHGIGTGATPAVSVASGQLPVFACAKRPRDIEAIYVHFRAVEILGDVRLQALRHRKEELAVVVETLHAHHVVRDVGPLRCEDTLWVVARNHDVVAVDLDCRDIPHEGDLHVSFLDVGHGNASHLEDSSGKRDVDHLLDGTNVARHGDFDVRVAHCV